MARFSGPFFLKAFTDFTRRQGIALLDLLPAVEALPREAIEGCYLSEPFHHPNSRGQALFVKNTLEFMKK